MKKRMIAMALALLMAFGVAAPSTTVNAATGATSTATEHGTTKFEDMKYTTPDIEGMMATLEAVDKALPSVKTKGEMRKLLNQMDSVNDSFEDVMTMYRLLNIYNYQDVTNADNATEMYALTVMVSQLQVKMNETAVALLDSKFGWMPKIRWGNEAVEAIYASADKLTDKLVDLSAKEQELSRQYLVVMNSTTVDVNGTQMTGNDILSNADLSAEEASKYYTLYNEAVNKNAGEVYLQLVKVRKAIAKEAGVSNYSEYAYQAFGRDYTAEEAKKMHDYVKKYIKPLYEELAASLTTEDVATVQTTQTNDLQKAFPTVRRFLRDVSGDSLKAFQYMLKYNLMDYNFSSTKANLSYTTYLPSYKEAFVSLSRTGLYIDVSTAVHEFGHFNSYYVHGNDLAVNLDLMEIHSQGFELLFMPYYKQVFGSNAKSLQKYQLTLFLQILLQGCMEDEFQQYVYANNVKSVSELNKLYYNLACEYGLATKTEGVTELTSWVNITHTFQSPLYYISYATSLVPALEIFEQSVSDWRGAADNYLKLLSFGTKDGFLTTLKEAGFGSPFEENTIKGISEGIETYMENLLGREIEIPAA
ncbi:MAG: hypothetical protein E7256_04200 [Lachnospiraceae bacterium]|nr:hypothetical protein [Lachnospiraceae bacterium]